MCPPVVDSCKGDSNPSAAIDGGTDNLTRQSLFSSAVLKYAFSLASKLLEPVSYTHLTLPTILLV